MISNVKIKHTKHTALEKPMGGAFHRQEWGIIGAPCDVITGLAKELEEKLGSFLKLGYLDADHNKGRKKDKFFTSYTDKISFQQIQTFEPFRDKQNRKYFNHLDLLLVNGNHFIADQQIIIIHEKKKESLSRKLGRLTNVKMILLMKSSDEIYDFVIEHLGDKTDIPIHKITDIDKISNVIIKEIQDQTPPLYGLVLAGGKSQRMGEDKGALFYHGKEQREYEADLLQSICNRVFISCRKNQDELIESRYTKLYDTFDGLGPYGGILSAFRAHPNAAWFTLSCDLPLLDEKTIKHLYNNRNPQKLATCFHNPTTEFPEPLITIWEPRSYPVLLEFLSMGYSCPRKVLINTDIEELEIPKLEAMKNVNDRNEYLEVKKMIH